MSFDVEQFIKRGEKLQSDIHNFAGRLAGASQLALDMANPAISRLDAELGEAWPLTNDSLIERRLTGLAMHDVQTAAEERPRETPWARAFEGSKFYDSALVEAYGEEAPRESFVSDLMKWVEAMQESGWDLLVKVDLGDESKVRLNVYQDSEAARAYLEYLTDASNLSENDILEGAEPYARLGERVVVSDPSIAARLSLEEK